MSRPNPKKCIVLFSLVIILAIPAWAVDLELRGGLGNIAFDRSEAPQFDPETPYFFKPNLFPIYLAKVSGEMGSNIYYNGGFEHDQILGNQIFGNMGINLDYFTLEAGPFLGIFNSGRDFLAPGISINVGLEFPEAAFFSFRAASSLGGNTSIPGAYTQNSSKFQAGLWVPYVRFSFNIENRNFIMGHEDPLITEDNLVRYFLRSEISADDAPYTIMIDLGYQSLERYYSKHEISLTGELIKRSYTDALRSIFLGFEGQFTINPDFKLILGAEIPGYFWSDSDNMVISESNLFSANIGIIWTLPKTRHGQEN